MSTIGRCAGLLFTRRRAGGFVLLAAATATSCLLLRAGTAPLADGGGAAAAGGEGGATACATAHDCAFLATTCAPYACAGGKCTPEPAKAGTPCPDEGGDLCDGAGHCRLAWGKACAEDGQCLGDNCADGVCCDSPCTDACRSCGLPGDEGSCMPYAAAEDPEGECGGGVCDGSGACARGGCAWSKGYTNDLNAVGYGVAVDANGNVLLGGSFEGSLGFGGAVQIAPGTLASAFAVALDSDGKNVWTRSWGDSNEQVATEVTFDQAGNGYVVGRFGGTVSFGGPPVTALYQDVFVVKLSAAGDVLWSRTFGGYGFDTARDVAVSATGEVIVVGAFGQAIDFGSGYYLLNAGGFDAFVAKLAAADGATLWAKGFGDASDQLVNGVAIAEGGALWLTGGFTGSIDFGGGALLAQGEDVYVAKLDSAGKHLVSRRFGDPSNQRAMAVAVDSKSRPVVVGSYAGWLGFDGNDLPPANGDDAFVVKLTSEGQHLESVAFGGEATQQAGSVAIDHDDSVLVAGSYTGAVLAGSEQLPVAGGSDLMVIKLSAQGVQLWAHGFGGSGNDLGAAIAVGPDGSPVLVGSYAGAPDLGCGALSPTAGNGVLVLKLQP